MRNLFNPTDNQNIINRIEKLQSGTPALWGKMNVAQMLAHCQGSIDIYTGDLKVKQSFIGKLFGGIAKKGMLSDQPVKRNLPTAKQFFVADKREFEKEKQALLNKVQHFPTNRRPASPVHPFFGKLTPDEWAILNYKHLDHHLRQFGV